MHTVDSDSMIHPLRNTLTEADWSRIVDAIEHNTDSVSTEELEAVNDVLFDHIAAQLQTHISTTVMQ